MVSPSEPNLGAPRINILLAEDNEQDAVLARECLRASGHHVTLHHVENGVQCLSFLRGRDGYENAPRPALVLLDLNMPIMGGQDVLREINADPAIRHYPVVVLTTSESDEDVREAYSLRCSGFITKPLGSRALKDVLDGVCRYWLGLVRRP